MSAFNNSFSIAAVPSWSINVTIDNVDPTTVELKNGTIWLHITWHADAEGAFLFVLKNSGVDDLPVAFTEPIDSKSNALNFEFESVSPGNYSLVAWDDHGSNNGVDLDGLDGPLQINVVENTTPTSTETTSTSNNPISNSQESTSKPNRSLIIGVIIGPVCFVALVLVVGVYFLRKRRASKNRTVLRPFDAQCVPTPHRKIEFTEPPENTNDNNLAVTATGAIRSPPRTRRHNDSGWRPGPPSSEVDSGSGSAVLDIPPEYEHAL
ncbi:hypothetical protein VNI00_008853 [Paramarasmius palmivorus]|uniref:Uncharacterized protein n=1 Tax=Paramarasmius palmivorus TaxID=297713 RepID=A0AAW0CS27_9AGAR